MKNWWDNHGFVWFMTFIVVMYVIAQGIHVYFMIRHYHAEKELNDVRQEQLECRKRGECR